MAQGAAPVEQRRLRAELRRIRDESGRTQKVVAEALGWSISKIIRMETGAVNISTSDLMALLSYYEINDPAHKEQLLTITRGKEEAWWDQYRPYHQQQFMNFLGYEDAAIEMRQFMGLTLPGLLQTEQYMRALFTGYMNEPEVIERETSIRIRRQEILARADGPRVQWIIDEAVLHRWVGGPAIMVEQLLHIKEMAERPNISIRIVPFTAGVNPGMLGSFTIFELTSEIEDYVVILEAQSRDTLIRDDPETISKYVEVFYQLHDHACDEEDVNNIVDPVIDSMRKGMSK